VLTKTEEPSTPFVFEDQVAQYREPSAIAVFPGDEARMSVYLYAVETTTIGTLTSDVIVRTRADDARSFYGTALDPSGVTPPVVLSPSLAWEGANLQGPSALRVGSRVFLYYAAQGGVGLAISADGLTFTKNPDPVLAPDPGVAWETTPPAAPSVALLTDGTYDMMYAAGVSIGEATSQDGVHFTRVDADPGTGALDPVLSPLGSEDEVGDGGGPFDTGQVSDPCVLPYVNAAGRAVVRVLYTGYDGPPGDAARSSAIGFAARFGDTGRLTRQPLPVFSIGMHEAAPAYFAWESGEMLYVEATAAQLGGGGYVSVAAGLAPVALTLDAPGAFPSSP
jgi:hypothetical protein